jgi:hypothetical protein
LQLRFVIIGAVMLWQNAGFAQSSGPSADSESPAGQQTRDPETRMFEHSATSPWWVSGQINVIAQSHTAFPAEYRILVSLQSLAISVGVELLTPHSPAPGTRPTKVKKLAYLGTSVVNGCEY